LQQNPCLKKGFFVHFIQNKICHNTLIHFKQENKIESGEDMDKATFIEALRSGRKQWDDLLAQIDESRMTEPMEEGGWSVKDTIIHMTWNEREMIDFCQQHALISDLWNVEQDERNARPVEEKRNVPLSEILAESQLVYAQFFEAVQTLSDEDLNDASRFRGLLGGCAPWELIAGCSFDHYPGHIAVIRRWLERSESTTQGHHLS
jgi:uncharacterized damage-inducible protein DinB